MILNFLKELKSWFLFKLYLKKKKQETKDPYIYK
jgi:hypothetical protein